MHPATYHSKDSFAMSFEPWLPILNDKNIQRNVEHHYDFDEGEKYKSTHIEKWEWLTV